MLLCMNYFDSQAIHLNAFAERIKYWIVDYGRL